ncbi:hypothetical protein K0M31_004623 [Melipona bicolor]|uniref:Uncharacterized protein n=1 Tax=Melipona bicolor TaxID=60889 RepID=A0AA40KNJ1_9HYME|nr:hypothetical protein K0M31_004623 [Melipona bicolor]
MSGTEAHGGDTSPMREPRQSRIHSVGLPARTSLLPEPPPAGSETPPPIPRRHSATPAVAPPPIPLRPPAIPKRSRNEKPIPIQVPTRKNAQTSRQKANDPAPPSSSILSSSWSRETNNEKLIDLGPLQTQDQPNGQEYTLRDTDEGNDFVADFDKANFDGDCKPSDKSSFEELQKASRDLEKRLHERIVKSAESKFKDQRQGDNAQNSRLQSSKTEKEGSCKETADRKSREKIAASRRETLQDDETKFAALVRSHREAEKRCKFEELQAASRKLERRLYEEDDHLRASKDRSAARYDEQKSAEAAPRGKYEAEMDRVRNILQHNLRKERNCEKLEKLPKATQTNLPPPLSAITQSSVPKPMSVRQDSNVSSDSFSQTSSPSYTSKTMEAPLLPHKYGKVPGKDELDDYANNILPTPLSTSCSPTLAAMLMKFLTEFSDRALVSEPDSSSGRTIIKSTSTPASLQAIVKVHGGNNGSLHHKAGTLGRARTNLEANVDFQSELVDTSQKAGNGFESSQFNWSPGSLQPACSRTVIRIEKRDQR